MIGAVLILGLSVAAVACGSSTSLKPSVTAGAQVEAAVRDWQRYPAVVALTGTSEIDAIGDLHGDLPVAVAVLRAAGLISPNPAGSPAYLWTGGSKVLVSVGDIIDKGPDAIGIIDMLIALEPQAAAAGGRIVVTLGNHEAEFVANPREAKTSQFNAELTQRGYDPSAVAAGQTTYGKWLLTRPVAALIDGWFFCHGGNTRAMSAAQIAAVYRRDFSPTGRPRFSDAFLIGPHSLLEAREWWYSDSARTPTQTLDLDLARLPARHIVFGHDPRHLRFPDDPAADREKGTMVARYDGRIFLIDVGMSHAMGYSSGSLLRIVRGASDTATQVMPDGRTEQIWP